MWALTLESLVKQNGDVRSVSSYLSMYVKTVESSCRRRTEVEKMAQYSDSFRRFKSQACGFCQRKGTLALFNSVEKLFIALDYSHFLSSHSEIVITKAETV